jgi:hypothetical protein
MAEDYEHLVDFTLGALCSYKEVFRFTHFFKRSLAVCHEPSPYPSKGRVLECRLRLKCDGTRAETRLRLLAKWMSPFKLAGASVQSTTSSQGVRISGSNGSNAGYTTFRDSVKSTGYPHHLQVSPSLPLLCVTMCHHISTGLYNCMS